MNIPRDNNRVPTLAALSSSDGATITSVKVDATLHRLNTSDGTTGSDFGQGNAKRDDNYIPVFMGVSSVDGVTPVAVYATASGQLLIQTT